MVIEIFGSGSTTPSHTPFGNEEWWTSQGQKDTLTAAGERQQYLLGKAIRTLYPDLFTNDFKEFYNTQFRMFSIHKDKSVQSAQAHLLGLLGNDNGQIINKDSLIEKMSFSQFPDIEKVNYEVKDSKLKKNWEYTIENGFFNVPVEYMPKDERDNFFLNDYSVKYIFCYNKIENVSRII